MTKIRSSEDRNYRHLVEKRDRRVAEWESSAKVDYTAGQDDEIDQLNGLIDYYFYGAN